MLKDLQEAKIGDQARLAYIMDRIEKGRRVYNSDVQYVRQKFVQLRGEITREPEDIPERADTSQDTTVPSEPQPTVPHNTDNDKRPSKAWYLLPVFLGILGGLITYVKLRKRNKGMAYKTLGLGVGLTMLFIVPVLIIGATESNMQNVSDEIRSTQNINEDVKRLAISIPYESLLNESDIHAGETVHYEGAVIEIQKHPFIDQYVLRTGITKEMFGASDIIWLNYKPVSDEERSWLDANVGLANPFDGEDETVQFWGVLKGLREYEGLAGNKVTIPEVDVSILERQHGNPEPQETITNVAVSSQHVISYNDVPIYADASTVKNAINSAVQVWDDANVNVGFTVVESNSDVNIQWARYMQGSNLGLHQAVVADDGTRESHTITVRLGIEDCHSTYQLFTHEALQYTIAHEIGHYLGLRHIDDKNHLMYSGELFNVDSARVYDDRGLGIPYVERPEVMTVAGMEIQSEIDRLNVELGELSAQRQELRDSQEALDENTRLHNSLTQQIQELRDQLVCVNIS